MAIAVFRPIPRPIQPIRRILPPAPPAFPFVQASNTSDEFVANVTEHTVALPAGINAGDLLIVAFSCHGVPTVSWPGGWEEIFELGEAGGGTATLAIAYRQATGGEGASIVVTTSGAEQSGHCSWRIIDHENPAVQPPEVSPGVTQISQGYPDPDELTPTGGAKNYLWLAIIGFNERAVTAFPSGYSGTISKNATTWDENGCAGCWRQLNAASENPGQYTISSSDTWVACTVGVHPYSGAAPPAAIGPPVGSQVI